MSASRHRPARTLAATALACGLAACAHVGGRTVPSAAHDARIATGSLVMRWPARRPSATRRRPQFISPSTLSVGIEVNGDPSFTTIANNPSPATGSTSSAIAFRAPVGNDTITFSLWDGANATGNQLGQATVVQTIAVAQANVVNATVDGLVSSIAAVPLPNQPSLVGTGATDANGNALFSLEGDLSSTFTAVPKDADGNVIIADGNPIAISASAAVTAAVTVVPAGSPNRFAVRPRAPLAANGFTSITLRAVDGQGSIASSNIAFQFVQLMYVAYANGGANGTVAALDPAGKRFSLPGAFTGIVDPVGIAYDPDDHAVFVMDARTGTLLSFAPDGTTSTGYTAPSLPSGGSIVYDTDTKLVYVCSGTTVAAFHPDGSSAASSVPGGFPGLSSAAAITFVPGADQIKVADAVGSGVALFHGDGSVFAAGVRSGGFLDTSPIAPIAVAADDRGLFAVGGSAGSATDSLQLFGAPGGTIGNPVTGLPAPVSLAFDLANAHYVVAERTSGNLLLYDNQLAGVLSTVPAPSGLASPTALTFVF